MNDYTTLIEQYQQENEQSNIELKTVGRKIHQLGTLKLLVFAGGIAAVIALRHHSYLAIAFYALAATIAFILLAVWQDLFFRRKSYLKTSIKAGKDEISAIHYVYSSL